MLVEIVFFVYYTSLILFFISPNSFSYKGSYLKYCIGVRVLRFLGFVLGWAVATLQGRSDVEQPPSKPILESMDTTAGQPPSTEMSEVARTLQENPWKRHHANKHAQSARQRKCVEWNWRLPLWLGRGVGGFLDMDCKELPTPPVKS